MGRWVSLHPLGVIVAIGCRRARGRHRGRAGRRTAGRGRQRRRAAPGQLHRGRRGCRGGARGRPRGPRGDTTARNARSRTSQTRTTVADIPTVTLADIEAAREAADRGVDHHAHGGVALALRARRRAGAAQVREPPAHRLVQDPRRLRADVAAHRRGARRAAWSRPRPATTPRAWRWPPRCSASRPPCSCPRARRSPRRRRPGGTAPRWSSRAATSTRRCSPPARFADETGAVLIHPFDHDDIVAGQGTCGLEILEQMPEVRTVLVPTGGGGLLAGHRDRDQGAAPRRTRGRRAGGRRRGVPAVADRAACRRRWSR